MGMMSELHLLAGRVHKLVSDENMNVDDAVSQVSKNTERFNEEDIKWAYNERKEIGDLDNVDID